LSNNAKPKIRRNKMSKYYARVRNVDVCDMTEDELYQWAHCEIDIDASNLNVAKNRADKMFNDKVVKICRYIANAEREYCDAVRINGQWHDGNGYGN
jgi:hypothetical protein